MDFHPCTACGSPVRAGTCVCPFCGARACRSTSRSAAALLLGLLAAGCPDKGASDRGGDDTSYGVAYETGGPVDEDGDGFLVSDGDCDEENPEVNPGAIEACDGDGYGDPESEIVACELEEGVVADGTDCDDTNVLIHPDAAETCDGTDEDCDEFVDEDACDTGDTGTGDTGTRDTGAKDTAAG